MDTKLTLTLDKDVIKKAKIYATSQSRSLSGIIESYLKLLVSEGNFNNKEEIEISPFVKSLSSGISIPNDLDYKKEYSDYMSNKHK
jgi:hypothetical protein